MHHKHILAICLIISAVLFVVISIGMVTQYSNIAIACGMVLVFLMTCGFFYATLHLSKFNIATKAQEADAKPADAKDDTANSDTNKPAEVKDDKASDTDKPAEVKDEKANSDTDKTAEVKDEKAKSDDAKPTEVKDDKANSDVSQ